MRSPRPAGAPQPAADPASSVWVGASAGTGKTKILTDRVLALLLGKCDPGRILCLTFTRAAAAEMAIRLNERLSHWATAADGRLTQELEALLGRLPDADDIDTARRLFACVLDVPGGMKIETIHAFCQSLLRRFPLEAQIAPHFEVMDERNTGDALAAARDATLTQARRDGDPALAAVARYAGEARFDALMAALIAERARLARALNAGADDFRERLCRALAVAPEVTPGGIVAAACDGSDFNVVEAARLMAESESKDDRARSETISNFLIASDRPSLFDDYCGVFLTQKGEERQRIATRAIAKASPESETALREEAARLRGVLRPRAAASLKEATLALATLGARMLGRYARYKEQRALLDYDDLVLLAGGLLRRPGVAPWVLFKLDGGLDHILIDEAQDTNQEQWDVVAALAEEFFVGFSARPLLRTVFAVGDAKQSIFSFQRADPAAFARMRGHFRQRAQDAGAGWHDVPLNVSYRSVSAVLEAVDAVFVQAPARAGLEPDGVPIRHEVARAGAGGLVELWPPVEPLEAPAAAPWEPPVEQHRLRAPPARLARAIAATIAGWLERGERLEARDRRIQAGDVMVLVRRRAQFVPEMVRALKDRGVEVAGADRMRLTDQLAIEDMMAVLQFVLLPEDDLTLATVLKGPLVGFDEDRLFDLAHDRRERVLWHELRRRAGEHPDFARAAELLGGLMGRADFAPPYELMAEILGARGGRRHMIARLGRDAADPLDELMAAALAFERRHGPSLQGFLQWLAAGDIEVKRDFEQRGRDEVRIRTVHGAKGLQAPIVFLPDTVQVPMRRAGIDWTGDGLPLWQAHAGCAAPALEIARADADRRRGDEYRRLLYVAMTRAEDRLYVCGWQTGRTATAGNWYDLVAAGLGEAAGVERFDYAAPAALGADGWSGPGLRLVSPQSAAPRSDRPPPTAAAAGRSPAWIGRPPPPEPVPPRPLAPSRPAGFEPAPRSPLGGDGGAGFRRGLLIHRLLQSLPQLVPGKRAEAGRKFLARPVHGLNQAAQEDILAETLAVLDDPAAAALFGPDSLAEVPVVGLVGGRAISGRIDRLVVDADGVTIVDFKTLRPAPESEDAIPAIYLDQLGAYRMAVALVYPGKAVRCGLLWTDGPRLMWVSDRLLGAH